MELTPADLARVRDYVGTTPDDTTLFVLAADATWWQDIAHRVLVRRRADAAAGGSTAKTFALDGVLSVSLTPADLATVTAQIDDLAAQITALNGGPQVGVSVRVMHRPDRYRDSAR